MKRSRVKSLVLPAIKAIEFAALALSLLILAVAFWSVLIIAGHSLNGLAK